MACLHQLIYVDMENIFIFIGFHTEQVSIILKHHEEMGFSILSESLGIQTARVFTYNINDENTPCPKRTLSYKHPEPGQILRFHEELFLIHIISIHIYSLMLLWVSQCAPKFLIYWPLLVEVNVIPFVQVGNMP